MEFVLCSPHRALKPIRNWQSILQAAGHIAHIVDQYEPSLKPDGIVYYSGVGATESQRIAALSARDRYATVGCLINSAPVWQQVRDKVLCGTLFEDAGLLHPSLSPSSTDKVVIKPRFGMQGRGVTCNISYDEARALQMESDEEMIIQQYIPGQTCRIVASRRRVLYSYAKVSDNLLASVTHGAKRVFFEANEQLQAMAVGAVQALNGDLMGIDIIRSDAGNYIIEANTGFAVYHGDRHVNHLLAEEAEWLVSSQLPV